MNCFGSTNEEKLHLTEKGNTSNPQKEFQYEPITKEKCTECIKLRKKCLLVSSLIILFFITLIVIAALSKPVMNKYIGEQTMKSSDNQQISADNSKNQNSNSNIDSNFPWNDIRLPKSIVPIAYDLVIHPNLTTFKYVGKVSITIVVKEKLDFIVFHSKTPVKIVNFDLKIKNEVDEKGGINLEQETDIGAEEVEILEHIEHVQREQVYLSLASALEEGHHYHLELEFSGELLDGLSGFYRSSYLTDAGQKRWLASTHFEATYARAAFPCFDEPQMKAVFTMAIIRDGQHISLFNTELVNSVLREDGLYEDHFAESVQMSTYLVAFVVCDYSRLTLTTSSGVEVSVYAFAERVENGQYALQVAKSVLEYYSEFFGVEYPMSKLDLIAIPDLGGGAMENWGLVTCRINSVLYNPQKDSAFNKQWVATVMSHELAHQWFGNLVTMKWWSDLWLNEGFATYMEYIGVSHVEPEWDMEDLYISGKMITALYSDSLSSSHPVSIKVNNPAAIAEIFDQISYDKGSAIIRMLQGVLGRSILQKGLQVYLQKFQYDNANTDDLWDSLSIVSEANGIEVNVKKVMDTWTLQMGYPLVKVVRNGNQIEARQERFLLNRNGHQKSTEFSSDFNYTWYIPLTYLTDEKGDQNQLHFNNKDIHWLYEKEKPITFTVPQFGSWIKFNSGFTGFYRVLYEKEDFDMLVQQLMRDHTAFSISDRANLLDDAFALAVAGYIDIADALELSKYLVKEESYVPWNVASGNLQYIGSMLQPTDYYEFYKEYVLSLTSNLLQAIRWETAESHLQRYLQTLILGLGVKLNDTKTVEKARQLFKAWMIKNESLPQDLQSIIYRAGVQYGGEDEWNYVLQKYQASSPASSDKRKLLTSLTTTTDVEKLKMLLKWSLDLEHIPISETISLIASISNNPMGRAQTWEFVKENWSELEKRYAAGSFEMSTLILRTGSQFRTQSEYNDVKDFYSTRNTGSGARAVTQALENIEINIQWMQSSKTNCQQWLQNQHQN